jgi:hypothetical protein
LRVLDRHYDRQRLLVPISLVLREPPMLEGWSAPAVPGPCRRGQRDDEGCGGAKLAYLARRQWRRHRLARVRAVSWGPVGPGRLPGGRGPRHGGGGLLDCGPSTPGPSSAAPSWAPEPLRLLDFSQMSIRHSHVRQYSGRRHWCQGPPRPRSSPCRTTSCFST